MENLLKVSNSYKLLDFLNNNNIENNSIDFLNIDVESRFEVLQGIDFKKIDIKLICVEMFDVVK